MGVIAALQQTSVAPAAKRAAVDLAKGFIAPAAGGRTTDLADRQSAVVGRVESAVAAQSDALAGAADKILATPPVEPTRFQPLSSAEAVVRYAGDFLPSWAGAVSIDLLPAVLVLILCIAHAGIRREGLPPTTAASMTAAELMTALRLVRQVGEAQDAARAVDPVVAPVKRDREFASDIAPQEASQNAEPDKHVTLLAPVRVRQEGLP
jgi:hypothetical protein